jgi:ABC-type branched-subunit amino acid transport system ATPase component
MSASPFVADVPALETIALSVRFGGVQALSDLSLKINASGLTGLIGPNGAGKSTFVDAVTGFLKGNATGEVLVAGEAITRASASQRMHIGLSRTWQSQELFEDLTVEDNLAVAASRLTVTRALRDLARRPRQEASIDETLALLGLQARARSRPRDLTQRERKLVGVGRAIVGQPRLAILDEPAAGLDRYETSWLGDRLAEVVASGVPILLIDHDMALIMRVSDEVHVLTEGKLLASGSPDEIRTDDRVIDAYLGRSGSGGNS